MGTETMTVWYMDTPSNDVFMNVTDIVYDANMLTFRCDTVDGRNEKILIPMEAIRRCEISSVKE